MTTHRKKIAWILIVVGLSLLGYGVNQTGQLGAITIEEPLTPGTYRVVKVVDGDTIDVAVAGATEHVRLIGVDTPETHDPRKPVQCFGQVAADWTTAQVEGKAVRLEADPQNSDRDKYRRLLRYAYLPDGRLLNAEIIKNGYGFAYTVFPYGKLDEFRNYERVARAEARGLWAGCHIDDTSKVKQTTGDK